MPSRPKIIFTLIICLAMLVWSGIGTWNVLKERSWPVEEGVIVDYQPVEWWRILDREMLIIKIKGSDQTVFARVNNFEKPLDPENVRFHYSGDPKREVFLDIEENPIPILIICFLSALFLGLFLWFFRKAKTGEIDVDDVTSIVDVFDADS